MKYADVQKLFFTDQSLVKNFKTQKLAKFPKISAVDPYEKKKKSKEDENNSAPETSQKDIRQDLVENKKASSVFPAKEILIPIIQTIKIQKDQGKVKTDFTVSTKLFDDLDISITTYNSDPHSVHIKISGNNAFLELTKVHMQSLLNQLNAGLSGTNIHLANPVLRKKDRYQRKNKKSIDKAHKTCYGAVNQG